MIYKAGGLRRANGSPYTAYTTSQGNTVVGVLYDTDGTMVTGQQLSGSGIPSSTPAIPEQEASDDLTLPLASITSDGPTTEVSEIARLYEDTENAFGFVLGHGGPVVHVFADPRCPYCRTHLQALSPAIHDGMVRVHVIPVGILGSRSAVKAVAIAGSEHPERAWYGDRSLATNKVEGAGHVKANNALHARWRARGVPFTVYEKAGEVRVVYGVGDDPAQMWKEAGQ